MSNTLTADADETPATATPQEVSEGKILALLCYVITIVSIVPFIQKNNNFTLYHAKQGLTLLIAAVAAQIALIVIGIVLGMVGLWIVSTILSLAFMVAVLGLIVIGALNAWNGRMKPLPVIGKFADKIFRNVAVK